MSNRKKASPAPVSTTTLNPKTTKAASLLALLQHDGGATIADMIKQTGWQAHTVRAALTGLRKKGHAITKGKRDDATCYSVVSAVAE